MLKLGSCTANTGRPAFKMHGMYVSPIDLLAAAGQALVGEICISAHIPEHTTLDIA